VKLGGRAPRRISHELSRHRWRMLLEATKSTREGDVNVQRNGSVQSRIIERREENRLAK